AIHSEQAGREVHHPQRGRGLVHRDEVGRVRGAEEERLPARGPGLYSGRVEAVGPAGGGQAPQVQQAGAEQQYGQGHLRPQWTVGRETHTARVTDRCGTSLCGACDSPLQRLDRQRDREHLRPGRLSTDTEPWWFSTTAATMASPRPVLPA